MLATKHQKNPPWSVHSSSSKNLGAVSARGKKAVRLGTHLCPSLFDVSRIPPAAITMFRFQAPVYAGSAAAPARLDRDNRHILPKPSSFRGRPICDALPNPGQLASFPPVLSENTYLARREHPLECLVIDPGLEPEKICDQLEKNIDPGGHPHHPRPRRPHRRQRRPETAAGPTARLVVGAGDAAKLTDPALNLSAAFGTPLVSPPADAVVHDGEVSRPRASTWKSARSPVIPPATSSISAAISQPMLAFVGDVIFAGGIGRTDFPDGDYEGLIAGIRRQLFTFPTTRCCCPATAPPRPSASRNAPTRSSASERRS